MYGYLKSDVKDLIDSIVDEVAKDERVSALYDLWYECKEEVLLTYSQSLPKRVSLSQNKEFKSVRNTVIEEAMNIVMRNALTNETLGDELPDPDYYITETDDVQIDPADESDNFTEKAESSDKWRLYALAKRLLDRETEYYNPVKRYIALYKRQCKIYRLQSIGWESSFFKARMSHKTQPMPCIG